MMNASDFNNSPRPLGWGAKNQQTKIITKLYTWNGTDSTETGPISVCTIGGGAVTITGVDSMTVVICDVGPGNEAGVGICITDVGTTGTTEVAIDVGTTIPVSKDNRLYVSCDIGSGNVTIYLAMEVI